MLKSNGCKCSNAKEPFRALETVQPAGAPILNDPDEQLEFDITSVPIRHGPEDHLELDIRDHLEVDIDVRVLLAMIR